MAKEKGYIEVTIVLSQEDDQWIGRCVELGTATHADTLAEAEQEICQMVELHLNALEDAGECRAFLFKNRVTFHKAKPKTAKNVSVRFGEYVTRKVERIVLPALA